MTKTIAVVNKKGGIGKTTSTISIGAALRELGHKVLLIDFDSQANMTRSLYRMPVQKTVGDFLLNRSSFKETLIKTSVNLDILPATDELSDAEDDIAKDKIESAIYLVNALEDVDLSGYDFILIDCPPALGTLTINALIYSDYYVVPVQADFYSIEGVTQLVDKATKVKKRLNPDLTLLGVFLTRFNTNTNKHLHKQVYAKLKSDLEDLLLTTTIRENIALAEAVPHSQDIFTFDSHSNGASDYLSLTKELLQRIK
ncbi:ParA family protein [Rufibacter sediminis]|uniref:ParA family protein n=1 Tax=Rufibacter sediminis TaxID=2762756 RepID=UPI00210EA679|nr:ParA family protein [Rufibacter sediminis]